MLNKFTDTVIDKHISVVRRTIAYFTIAMLARVMLDCDIGMLLTYNMGAKIYFHITMLV